MTHLLDLYDPFYKRKDDEYDRELVRLAKQIHLLPRWRWLRRLTLRWEYEQVQRKMGYLREAADEEVRDRLLRQAAGA